MKIDVKALGARVFRKIEPLPSWQWAAQNVDYSRAGNYDTPYRGMFDPDLMPFWKEPLEAMQDRDVREVAILKCSRAGYSENMILTDLRYTVARNPEPTMYITGSMDIAKGFHDRRVRRGMTLSKETAREHKNAKEVNTEIQFPGMDYRSTWASSDSAVKSDGWARLYVDELSLMAEGTVDMVRRRCSAYPFHHICFGGSIDPTRKGDPNEDPMVKLYEESDKRVWMMPDGDGGWFEFTLSGIKWDQDAKKDGEWDMDIVRDTAHYVTPSGKVIRDSDRMAYVRRGKWVATCKGIRRGYKVTAPMVPFSDCSFGELAVKFLSAKNRGIDVDKKGKTADTLRVFFAEYLAEPHWEKKRQTTQEELVDRVADYQYGTKIETLDKYKDKVSSTFATVDVQKTSLYLLIRQWFVEDGTSGLVYASEIDDWKQVFELCKKYGVERIYCDAGYALRAEEVYGVALKTPGFIPVIDNDKLQGLYRRETIDPYEGTRRQSSTSMITRYVVNPNLFRHKTMELMRGEVESDWHVPRGTPMEYFKQVTAESFIAGTWVKVRRDNHFWDCEVLQTFAATRHRILLAYNDTQSIDLE